MRLKFEKKNKYRVRISESDHILASNCELAMNFFKRLKGLMFRMELPDDEALLILPCNSIHTFFMRFPIDLVFIDMEGVAVSEYRDVIPGKALKPVRGAFATLELRGGRLDRIGADKSITGKRLVFETC
jgi:uncharacterized membrane protein (UPF0127 family)